MFYLEPKKVPGISRKSGNVRIKKREEEEEENEKDTAPKIMKWLKTEFRIGGTWSWQLVTNKPAGIYAKYSTRKYLITVSVKIKATTGRWKPNCAHKSCHKSFDPLKRFPRFALCISPSALWGASWFALQWFKAICFSVNSCTVYWLQPLDRHYILPAEFFRDPS